MSALVLRHPRFPISGRDLSPFQTLAGSIIGQQLSAKSATTIKNRVLEALTSFSPEGVLDVPFETLRGAGLSTAKARYIVELATSVLEGRIDFAELSRRPDDEVIGQLTSLPGIGRWTADMFLMFGLLRPNVLALSDAGLRRSVRLLYGNDAELEIVGQRWQPYRSVAAWYLWQHLDAVPIPSDD